MISLSELRLLDSTSRLTELFDISSLEELQIQNCENVAPLLGSLAKASKEVTSVMYDFKCSGSELSADAVRACEGIFESIETLESVHVSSLDGDALLSIASLQRNFRSLEVPILFNAQSGIYYGLFDLASLASQRPHMEELSLSSGDLRECIDGLETLEPFNIGTVQDYAASLVGHYPKANTSPTNQRSGDYSSYAHAPGTLP